MMQNFNKGKLYHRKEIIKARVKETQVSCQAMTLTLLLKKGATESPL